MPYAVALTLDAATEAAVRRLWDALAGAGLTTYMRDRYRPHVTLAGCRDVRDRAGLESALAAFAAAQSGPPPALLSHLGAFPGGEGVLFWGAAPSTPLLLLHRRLVAAVAPHGVDWSPYYEPGTWVPHCTLAHGLAPADLPAAFALLQTQLPAAVIGTFAGIALIEVPSGREMAAFPLLAKDEV